MSQGIQEETGGVHDGMMLDLILWKENLALMLSLGVGVVDLAALAEVQIYLLRVRELKVTLWLLMFFVILVGRCIHHLLSKDVSRRLKLHVSCEVRCDLYT